MGGYSASTNDRTWVAWAGPGDTGGMIDALTLYGVVAVVSMLVLYTLEPRHAGFVLAFAGACVASSVYGFLQGAWPVGVVEAVWSVVAVARWRVRVGGG